ncbi:MAG: hypothetical protein R3C56_36105 [Pirellulaceae bacterium]
MMPPLGRSLSDDDAYELLSQWIQEMPANEALAEAAHRSRHTKMLSLAAAAERGKVLIKHKVYSLPSCRQRRLGRVSDVGKRTKPEYLLESVVDPNAQIAKQYQTEVVITDDGRVIARVISEDRNHRGFDHEPQNWQG